MRAKGNVTEKKYLEVNESLLFKFRNKLYFPPTKNTVLEFLIIGKLNDAFAFKLREHVFVLQGKEAIDILTGLKSCVKAGEIDAITIT